ncbi:hypothetical protein SCH4B_4401 [Ruegeria sp. TrichCH4B]|nr:hypothetical protein SCH4B_4401 [Ruegeria sp. TrichCH4B]
MAVRSKSTIFQSVLLRCGESEASQGSAIWRAMEVNYDEIVRVAFEEGDGAFPFGRKYLTLTSRADGDFGFADKFTLPHGVFHIAEVYLDGCSASELQEAWEIDATENVLLVNANKREVKVRAVVEGLEHTWSGLFTQVIQKRLEAVVKGVQEEEAEAAAKDQDADFLLMKSGVKASKNRSNRRVMPKGGRLVNARFSRSSRSTRRR